MARNRRDDDDEEINNIFYIPNNFTDSGRVFQGMFEMRNVVEACILCVVLGYILWHILTLDDGLKFVIEGVVLLPIGILTLIGFQGDSLTRFIKALFLFLKDKRKLRYRRIKKNDEKANRGGVIKATNKKKKSKTKTA